MAETKTTKLELNPENKAEFDKLVSKYPTKESTLMPLLRLIERQEDGISNEGIELAAELTGLTPAYVWGVVSFYTHFKRESDGKYVIQVCRTLSCALAGAFDLIEHLEKRLGIKLGDTTKDGKFTLKEVECLGSCGTAPVVQIEDNYYESLTIEALDKIIDELEKE
jgi:NADH-quinone oxidoreductase subunit E